MDDPTNGDELWAITFDACPDDPAKREVGACGCGIADTDADSNGVADCLVGSEFKYRIQETYTLLSGLKAPHSAKQAKAAKKRVSQIKKKLSSLVRYSRSKSRSITMAKGVVLKTQVKKVEKAVLEAVKYRSRYFARDKKAALTLLKKLKKAVL